MSFDPQKAIKEQAEAKRSQSWFLTKAHEFTQAHNRLKHTVHTAWRYPLPPWGRFLMGCFYFSIPVTGGYYLMSKTVSKSEETMHQRLGSGVDGEGGKIQGIGQHAVIKDQSGERVEKVGAGGWGGGVHLANSDERTQDVNRINLERFLRKQRKLKAKREREAQKKVEEA
ncbi:unnamed protein product [Cylindrotheca closterium]|uniref:Uncharacterized protein n=1 Tax=Cylindrotheca closterium TaxID=2856 RepID=A0AAD2FPG9_9STRA|nr:unnamed protein product [Cylindrotheca closterium]